VKNSTSINSIWQAIGLHYGFQSTGAHFLDFDNTKRKADKRPEDLYHLLAANGSITHHGETPSTYEELSPTLKNLTAAIRNFHLGPCKIEKSKIAKLCHNKGLPKPFIKI